MYRSCMRTPRQNAPARISAAQRGMARRSRLLKKNTMPTTTLASRPTVPQTA